MANMRAIRSRIKSVKNTQQITKAMKMVAVSKLRRTQAGMNAMRPFAENSQRMLDTLLCGENAPDNRFITPHPEVKKVCYVLFLGNRGLCGMYNSALMHFMRELADKETRDYSLIVCGRWGRDVLTKSGMPVSEVLSELSDTPTEHEALGLSDHLKELFLSGEADEVHLVYQQYISALSQRPASMQLLPVKAQRRSADDRGTEFIFEPSAESVLESVMQLYINNKVLSVMLEAKSGEHSSRMTAMTAATDNTKELIGKLGLSLNRARQAAITTEISEIVGGAAALKKKH